MAWYGAMLGVVMGWDAEACDWVKLGVVACRGGMKKGDIGLLGNNETPSKRVEGEPAAPSDPPGRADASCLTHRTPRIARARSACPSLGHAACTKSSPIRSPAKPHDGDTLGHSQTIVRVGRYSLLELPYYKRGHSHHLTVCRAMPYMSMLQRMRRLKR